MNPAAGGSAMPVFEKIIVGYDGSEHGDDALALGRALRARTGAELVIARIFHDDAFLDPGPAEVQPALERIREQRAVEVLSELRQAADLADAEARVVPSTSAPRGLHGLADELGADLIVVGSSHRGKLGRVLAGSVGERLLHGAPCAVAVAPRGFAERRRVSLEVIGVGYDGRPESELALEEAARLSASVGAALKVFAVSPFTPFGKGWNLSLDVVDVAERDRLKQRLEAAVAGLPEESRAEGLLLSGHPAEVLAEQEVDLLVVGSRGYGPFRTVLLGGVSGPLVRSASSPVLVLPRGVEPTRRPAPKAATAAAV